MPENLIAEAYRHFESAIDELRAAAQSATTTDDELRSVLTVVDGMSRQLAQLSVTTAAKVRRRE